MAGETELERMVIRLIGDASSYQTMLKESEQATEQTGKTVESVGKKIEATGESLKKFGKSVAIAGAAMSAAITAPILAVGKASLSAFSIQEAAEIRLEAAVKRNTKAKADQFEEYKKFASELQKVTVIGDEATLEMLQQAEALGLTGEAAMRAAKNAAGLGAALNMGTRGALRYAAALEQGDTTMLNRYLPSLREIEDQTERVAEAQRLLGEMFGTAEAEAKTFRGQIQQLKNDFGDVFEEAFGSAIADGIRPFIKWMKKGIGMIGALSKETKRVIVVIALLVAAIGPVLLMLGATLGISGQLLIGIHALIVPLKTLGIAFTTMGLKAAAAWAAATLGISLLITGLVSLGIALYQHTKIFEDVAEAFQPLIDAFKESWKRIKKQLLPQVKRLFKTLAKLLVPALEASLTIFTAIIGVVAQVAEAFADVFITALSDTLEVVNDLVDALGELKKGLKVVGWVVNPVGMAAFNAASKSGETGEGVIKEVKEVVKETEKLAEETEMLAKSSKEWQENMEGAGVAVQRTLEYLKGNTRLPFSTVEATVVGSFRSMALRDQLDRNQGQGPGQREINPLNGRDAVTKSEGYLETIAKNTDPKNKEKIEWEFEKIEWEFESSELN